MKYIYISFKCFVWVFFSYEVHIYISFGSFVWGVFYEIHIYIIWVFCPGFFAMKYIYYIYIIWVFCPGFFSMKYMYISSGCFVWGFFSYEIHIYIIWVFCLTFGMSRLLLATIIAVIFLNGLGVVFFFFEKTCIIISYFRFQLRHPCPEPLLHGRNVADTA